MIRLSEKDGKMREDGLSGFSKIGFNRTTGLEFPFDRIKKRIKTAQSGRSALRRKCATT